jgi:hypothetical protein
VVVNFQQQTSLFRYGVNMRALHPSDVRSSSWTRVNVTVIHRGRDRRVAHSDQLQELLLKAFELSVIIY